jgi:hypothetical protein
VLVEHSGEGRETAANSPTDGWLFVGDYAYTWADIVTVGYFNGGSTQIASPPGTVSGNGNQTPQVGSYYPWQGDQCNCWNVIRVDKRVAERSTSDEVRIAAFALRAGETSPGILSSSDYV